jgi:hypothetical protein
VTRTFRDDLPAAWISPMRAAGVVSATTLLTFIRLGESEFSVGVTHMRFANGGDWAFFVCPQCSGRARKLWLLDGAPHCRRCCIDRNVRCRVESMSVRQRAEISVSRLIARLNGTRSVGLHPRPGRGLARRARFENSLRLAQLALKRHRFKGLKSALAAARRASEHVAKSRSYS